LWVSIDGYEEQHNKMRGTIYCRVLNNIIASFHKGIYINFTIYNDNYNTFSLAAEQILSIRNVKGILFHLYTPYIGGDDTLVLNARRRKLVLRQLFMFKFKHPLATFNTFAGISAFQKDNWDRPTWASVTINQGHISDCCCRLGIYNAEVCMRCGCSPAVETWVLQTFKISAILESLRYL
jgi:sulfatase maturation enzyme AslB (radical SAM superfamily)